MLAALIVSLAIQAASPGIIGEVRVHGNHTTPDADILGIVGDVVGKPATDALIKDIGDRLDKSGRFTSADVLKRYRSIPATEVAAAMASLLSQEAPGVFTHRYASLHELAASTTR